MDLYDIGCSDAREGAVGSTNQAKITAWTRWVNFGKAFEIQDQDLTSYSQSEQYRIVIAFIAYTRRLRLRKGASEVIKTAHLRKIITAIGQTIILRGMNDQANPFTDGSGKLRYVVSSILHSYDKVDIPTKHMSPLTPSYLRLILSSAKSPRQLFIAHLIIGAFFFACRVCEYTTTPNEPRSKIIICGDIQFFTKSDNQLRPSLIKKQASSMSILFRMQKNLEANEKISNHKSGSDLCPITSWSYVINTLQVQHGNIEKMSVNNFKHNVIKSSDISRTIKSAIRMASTSNNQLKPANFSPHSIRCGAALAMYLNKVSVVDIMLQGQWSSDAFLLYIKREILELSSGISSRMTDTLDLTPLPIRDFDQPIFRSPANISFGSSSSMDFIRAPHLHLMH